MTDGQLKSHADPEVTSFHARYSAILAQQEGIMIMREARRSAIAIERDGRLNIPDWERRRRAGIREAARKARRGEGFIYVAEVTGTDTIKIGYTVDTAKMVKRIASDHHVAVKVIGTMPATIMQERALHARLKKYRNPGPVRGCATEFYPRSVMLNAAFPLTLIAAIEDASKVA